ncbi:MAG: DUF1987 domain-containing protein [Bacteroidales bacterium]|nr:DUF1987 domain-containing protein [Bacteroidales bacterium]
MKVFISDPSGTTPKVLFDPTNNKFEISGYSRPEDVRAFYKPIISWLKDFGKEIDSVKGFNKPIEFNFKLIYFNSSSAKFLLDILIEINNFHKKGVSVSINWYYDDGDDDMKEVGEDLSEMVDFPFKYIAVYEK